MSVSVGVSVGVSVADGFQLVGLPVAVTVGVALCLLRSRCSPALAEVTLLAGALAVNVASHQLVKPVSAFYRLLDELNVSLQLRLASYSVLVKFLDPSVRGVNPLLKSPYVHTVGPLRDKVLFPTLVQNLLALDILEVHNLTKLFGNLRVFVYQVILNLYSGRSRQRQSHSVEEAPIAGDRPL